MSELKVVLLLTQKEWECIREAVEENQLHVRGTIMYDDAVRATNAVYKRMRKPCPEALSIIRAMIAGEWKCETCAGYIDLVCDLQMVRPHFPCAAWEKYLGWPRCESCGRELRAEPDGRKWYCLACEGSLSDPEPEAPDCEVTCPTCGGSGTVAYRGHYWPASHMSEKICPDCHGSGRKEPDEK